MADGREIEMLAAACVTLLEYGVGPDVQTLLVLGNPAVGTKPGALAAVLRICFDEGQSSINYTKMVGIIPMPSKLEGSDHGLVDDTLVRVPGGIVARCVCGWSSGPCFTSLTASALFRTHLEEVGATIPQPRAD